MSKYSLFASKLPLHVVYTLHSSERKTQNHKYNTLNPRLFISLVEVFSFLSSNVSNRLLNKSSQNNQ